MQYVGIRAQMPSDHLAHDDKPNKMLSYHLSPFKSVSGQLIAVVFVMLY